MRRSLAHISEAIVKDGFYPFPKASPPWAQHSHHSSRSPAAARPLGGSSRSLLSRDQLPKQVNPRRALLGNATGLPDKKAGQSQVVAKSAVHVPWCTGHQGQAVAGWAGHGRGSPSFPPPELSKALPLPGPHLCICEMSTVTSRFCPVTQNEMDIGSTD